MCERRIRFAIKHGFSQINTNLVSLGERYGKFRIRASKVLQMLETACFGCGQATFRLLHAACLLAPVFPDFVFDLEGGLLVARAMFSPRCGAIASSIQAYRAVGKN